MIEPYEVSAATPAWSLTRDDMQKLHGQAHAGAMLGGDNAYQACLAIEGILARVAKRVATPADYSQKSASLLLTSHNSGEGDPSVMPDCGGADTAATSAVGGEARDKIAAIVGGQHWADFEDDACGCKTCELERDHCRKLADQILALAIPPASPLRGREIDQADYKIGWWLSGALEDPNVCAEMKADINKWFEAHQPGLVTSASSTSPQEQPAAAPATEREWQPMSLAPKDAEIIGMDSDGRIFNMRWEPDDSGENWYDVHGDQLAYPVRWMPMPFPAASDKKTPAPKLNADRENKTYYLERSKVREILIDHNAGTQVGMGFFRWSGLSKIDALPIFTVEDFRAQSPILSDQCLQVPRKEN